MGLDSVEFVIALEDAFGISIPDDIASTMYTPRAIVDFVEQRVVKGTTESCHSQRAFYKLRRAVMQAHRVPRRAVRPRTEWREVLASPGFSRKWKHLGGVVGTTDWPNQWALGGNKQHSRTIGGTAEYLALRRPAFVKGEQGWSRAEIQRVVTQLMKHELGIESFGWDQSFKDLGVS